MKTTLAPSNENMGGHGRGRGRGLVSVSSALTSAGVQAAQAAAAEKAQVEQWNQDCAMVERVARDLDDARKAAGCRPEWVYGAWSARMADCMASAVLAVHLWRVNLALTRDSNTGEDVITAAASDSRPAKQVARQALYAALDKDRDQMGESFPAHCARWEWSLWYAGDKSSGGESPAQKQARWQAAAAGVWDKVAKRPGRSKQLAAKGLRATELLLQGAQADEACDEAGFKSSKGYKGKNGIGYHGAVSSVHRFAAALRRCGKHVVSIRGRWAQDFEDYEKAVAQGLREVYQH
jgi:hypothetical protein